jgi:diguanylate cyclase (GGDEF)-like protein/PAS domain S-box-containing protein
LDTETLAQRLSELQTLLAKVQHEVHASEAAQSGKQPFSETVSKTASKTVSSFAPDASEESNKKNLLDWLLTNEQQLLDESHQHILLLLEILHNNPVGLGVVTGQELVFRLVNDAYQHMLPNPAIDPLGQPYEKVWPTTLGIDGDKLIRQMLDSKKNLNFDRLELRYPDGQIHNFSLRVSRLAWYGEPGALILLQETTQADRARHLAMEIAEEAHRQAEELDAIIMAMVEAVIIFDIRGMAIRANPAALELYGIDPVGLDRSELVELLSMRHQDGSPVAINDLPSERALLGETVVGQRVLLIDNEGRERVILASASPLYEELTVTYAVTVWHDVTERERLVEQLEIEQSRLETIIKNAPEAILVADEEGRLVLTNPAAERILGQVLPYEQDVESYALLNICYNDGSPYESRNLPLTRAALDGEQSNNIEMLVIHPDGQTRNILASTAPIVDRKGNLNGAVGVLQDITERKLAEGELRRQASRSQLLASLSREFAEAGLHTPELLDTIVRQVGRSLSDFCSLHLFDEEGKWYYPAAAFIADKEQSILLQQVLHDVRFPLEQGLTAQVYQTGQPAIATEIPAGEIEMLLPVAHNLFANLVPLMLVNALVVPLRAHGRWIGALSILRFQKDNHFTLEDQAFLQDLADRAALAIENTWLYDREAQRAHELQALHRATTALLSTIDLETLLAQILDAAQQAIPAADQGILYLLSTEDNRLEVRAAIGCQDLQSLSPELQQQATRAVQEKSPLILNAIATLRSDTHAELSTSGSAIIAPLTLDQSVLGALVLFGAHPKLFSESDLSLLDNFAITATAALQNATLYAEVQRLATMDTVTEQFNRRKFFELGELEIRRMRRFHNALAAIMLDLDNFKEINDTHGHGAGDQVLRAVAHRCRASIRMVDILGRYGGDEFAILLPGADLAEAHEIAERIRQTVAQTVIPTDRGAVAISISLGVAQAQQDMESLSVLLGRADAALYSAKQAGRNQVIAE